MNYPKVSIIILNWNGLEDTIECLESLKKITYPNYEVIVVDNGSKGNDAQVLQEKFGNYMRLIQNDKNYGYTGGNNIGIRYALNNSSPGYFLILNNDIVVAPDFLTQMIEVADNDNQIGIVGPKVYYFDSPNRIQSAGMRINMRKGQTASIGIKQIDIGQYDTQQEMDCVAGCCLLVKNKVIQKVGLFDEGYFCYWDEVDYCARVSKSGYKINYVPQGRVWHKKALKAKLWAEIPAEQQATALSYYYWARNNFRFMRKHATKGQYCSFLLHFFGCHLLFVTGVCLLYHRNPRQLLAFCRGTRDGIFKSENGAKFYIKD